MWKREHLEPYEKVVCSEEDIKLNMAFLEAIHNGAELYTRPSKSKYRLIRWLLGQ